MACRGGSYTFPVWRHAPNSHIRRPQVIQSKCLRIIAGAPWYVSTLQLHEELEVPYLAEPMINLARFSILKFLIRRTF